MDASKALISRKSFSVSILSSDNIDVDFQDDNDDDGASSSSYACCPQPVLPVYRPKCPFFLPNTCSTLDHDQDEALDSLDFHSKSNYMHWLRFRIWQGKIKKIEKNTGLANDLAHWVNVNLIEHYAVEKKTQTWYWHSSLCTARTS